MSRESVPPVLEKLFKHIDENKPKYIETLKEAVAIESVSGLPEKREEVIKMIKWTDGKLKKLGAKTQLRELGNEKFPTGQLIKLPPAIIGEFPMDPKKKTVLIYGHLDVQPAYKEDGWDTEPFVLTEKDGKLYGRGSSDDKGPVLCWIHAIEGFQMINEKIPVNIKFVFEGMEESGSKGLDELLISEKNGFLKDVDYVCISDNYWLGTEKPCITYGLRGISYFGLEIECTSKDLHSGVFGGTVYEGMSDLIYMLNTLVDKEGKILIKNIDREVAPVTPQEEQLYKKIEFDVNEYKRFCGVNRLLHKEDKTELLMHRWRHPTLSIHGIQGAFSEPGAKTVIPSKVIGKFSIRTVPNQDPKQIEKYVQDHVDLYWQVRDSVNKMKLIPMNSGKSWLSDPTDINYRAGVVATEMVYGVEPDMTREGGSIPVTITLQEYTGKNVMLLPVGAGDDGAHSQNEKIDIRNYIQGTKLLGAYLYIVGTMGCGPKCLQLL